MRRLRYSVGINLHFTEVALSGLLGVSFLMCLYMSWKVGCMSKWKPLWYLKKTPPPLHSSTLPCFISTALRCLWTTFAPCQIAVFSLSMKVWWQYSMLPSELSFIKHFNLCGFHLIRLLLILFEETAFQQLWFSEVYSYFILPDQEPSYSPKVYSQPHEGCVVSMLHRTWWLL